MNKILALLFLFSTITVQAMDVGSSSKNSTDLINFSVLSSDKEQVYFTASHIEQCRILKEYVDQFQEQDGQSATIPFSKKTLNYIQELIDLAIFKENQKIQEKINGFSQKDFVKLFKAVTYLDCALLKPILISLLVMSSDQKQILFTTSQVKHCKVLEECIDQSQKQHDDQLAIIPFPKRTLNHIQELINLVIAHEEQKIQEKLNTFSQKDFVKLFKAVTYLDCALLKPIMMQLLAQNNSYAQKLIQSRRMNPIGTNELKSNLIADQTFLTAFQEHMKPITKQLDRNRILRASFDGISYPSYNGNHSGYDIIDVKTGKKIDTLYFVISQIIKTYYFKNKYYVALKGDKSMRIGRTNASEYDGGFTNTNKSKVNSVDLYNDQFITGSDNGTLDIIDMVKKDKIQLEQKHTSPVYLVKYSIDGTYFVSVSTDGIITLWDVKDKKCINSFEGLPYNHATLGKIVSFSPMGQLAYIAHDKTIHIFTIDTCEDEIITVEGLSSNLDEIVKLCSLCYSPDGSYLAYHVEGNGIGVFDNQSKKTVFKTNRFAQEKQISHICFDEESSHLIVLSENDPKYFTVWHYPLFHAIAKSLDISQILLLTHIQYLYETTGKKPVVLRSEQLAQLPQWMRNNFESSNLLKSSSIVLQMYEGMKEAANSLWLFK